MSRFYVPKENVTNDMIHVEGKEAHHILDVMRMKEGDKVVVFDGTGREYTGFISEAKTRSLSVQIVSRRAPKGEMLPVVTLAQSIPKREKMDYIVEKATELGVSCIQPIISERTIVRPEEEKARLRVERWGKIAREASKQCGRPDVPEVKDIKSLKDSIKTVNDYDLALMACLSDETMNLRDSFTDFESGKIIVFVGPEGDFTPEEIKATKETSCKFISLGHRVLRSDTAGLYILSILNYELAR